MARPDSDRPPLRLAPKASPDDVRVTVRADDEAVSEIKQVTWTPDPDGLPAPTVQFDPDAAWRDPVPGDKLAGATVETQVARAWFKTVWRARAPSGREIAVHALAGGADAEQAARFADAASRLLRFSRATGAGGVIRARSVDASGRAYATDLWTRGSLVDVRHLGWSLDERLAAFRRVASAVRALHGAGLVHGCLRPGNVLLDDDQRPLLGDVGFVDVARVVARDPNNVQRYTAYVAPEVRDGAPADAASDIYALGRLLQFLLLSIDPPEGPEAVPVLESIADAPAGLVRIVRRCVVETPSARYPSVTELLADLSDYGNCDHVGLAHPHRREINRTSAFPPPPYDRRARQVQLLRPRSLPPSPAVSAVAGLLALIVAALIGAALTVVLLRR